MIFILLIFLWLTLWSSLLKMESLQSVRTIFFILLMKGGSLGYGSPRSLLDSQVKNCKGDLQELKPTLMAGVPAIWEKVKKAALEKLRKQSLPLKIAFWSAFHWKKIELICGRKTPLFDQFIFSKIKDQIGGKVRILLSGILFIFLVLFPKEELLFQKKSIGSYVFVFASELFKHMV